MDQTLSLLCDVHSNLKDRECYGRKGDKVTVISCRGEVLIVASVSGNRFPVHIKKLSVEVVTAEPAVTIPPVTKPQAKPVQKIKTRELAGQSKLF